MTEFWIIQTNDSFKKTDSFRDNTTLQYVAWRCTNNDFALTAFVCIIVSTAKMYKAPCNI